MKLPSIKKASLSRITSIKNRVSINKHKEKKKIPPEELEKKPDLPPTVFKSPAPKNPLDNSKKII